MIFMPPVPNVERFSHPKQESKKPDVILVARGSGEVTDGTGRVAVGKKKASKASKASKAMKKASKATAVVKAMKKRALGASEVKVKVQVAEAPKAMKKKSIRAAGKVRERGLCMEPRYVASRGYAKVRVAYIREKLLAHGLTKIKEATKKQRLRWGVKGKELGREEHARLMAMAAQNLD